MASDNPPTLEQVVEWAKKTGAIAKSGFGKDHEHVYKSATDLVTEVDHQCEDFLVESILTAFPSHSILAEESGSLNGQNDNRWYIDPLDGTINYAHHLPYYAISIAYQSRGKVQLGVIYDPSNDHVYAAERGRGAWLNDQKIHVSKCEDLEKSLLSTAFARENAERFSRNMRIFTHLAGTTHGVRRMGSAALELCYVASGILDAFWELQINAWDVAAGALIVEEAGGVVSDIQGNPDYFMPPYAVLASAPGIHGQLVELFERLKK